jgi:hypothetical protein
MSAEVAKTEAFARVLEFDIASLSTPKHRFTELLSSFWNNLIQDTLSFNCESYRYQEVIFPDAERPTVRVKKLKEREEMNTEGKDKRGEA